MRAPGPVIGMLAALALISASPTPPPVPTVPAPTATTEALAADNTVGPAAATSPGVKVVAPNPEAVALWCNAEQQGAHTLAEQLRRKEREMDEASRSLTLREVELKATEASLGTRLAELKSLRDEIAGLLQKSDAETEEHVAGLVKMVEANRAKASALIVAELDPELAVRVLERMNTQKAGKLLAELPPAQAASLATRFTKPVPVEPR